METLVNETASDFFNDGNEKCDESVLKRD